MPGRQHVEDRHRRRLHRLLEHLGIRHDGRRPDRRHVPPPHRHRHDDVEPTYLPAGRGYVFTSNRQTKSSVNQALGRSYKARDEYERETVFNLHTMDADGGNVTQISFNQSHDRNPTVRQNGDIMFSRWDHVGGRNHFKVFRSKPDGTDMFILYGAHSGATASCTRATWTRRASTPASSLPT